MDLTNVHGIPKMLVVAILVSGLLLYVLFVLIDKYFIAFVNKKRIYSKFQRLFARVKLLCWFIWFVVSVYFLLLLSTVITLVFLIGIYLFSKDFWKNIYAGLFFINMLKEGDYIYISKLKLGGVIKGLMISDIKLQNANKELIYVPYSLLTNSPLIRKERSGNYFVNEFVLNTDKATTQIDDKKIRQIIANCPWTIGTKPVDIDFLDSGQVKISVYTYSKESAVNQREYIISQLK